MLCTKCGKNQAAYYYKMNVNGKVSEVALCPVCLEELNLQDTFSPADFGVNLFSGLFDQPMTRREMNPAKVCTLCGATFQNFVKTGKAGCAKCYEVFRNELADTIAGIHGACEHTGRAPKDHRAKYEQRNRLKQLKAELQKAIDIQDFESAAKLRDEINGLEQ